MLSEKLVRPMLERQAISFLISVRKNCMFASFRNLSMGFSGVWVTFFSPSHLGQCAFWTLELPDSLKSASSPVRAPTDPARLGAGLCYDHKETDRCEPCLPNTPQQSQPALLGVRDAVPWQRVSLCVCAWGKPKTEELYFFKWNTS